MAGSTRQLRRRWTQYRLRTLLTAMLLAALGLGVYAARLERLRKQNRAIAELQQAGACVYSFGEVVVTTEAPFFHCGTGLRFYHSPTASGPMDDRALKWLRYVPEVARLDLSDSNVSDDGLRQLSGMKDLKNLFLRGTRVSDAGLHRLYPLTGLQTLDLTDTDTSDAGVRRLQAALPGTSIDYIREDAKPAWERLDELGARMTVDGFGGLRQIDLSGCRFADRGGELLEGFSSVDHVNLAKSDVTDAVLQHLQGLSNLRHLDLKSTRVSDAGAECLSSFARLEYLDLTGAHVTDAGAAGLRAALPQCKIYRVADAEREAWSRLADRGYVMIDERDHVCRVQLLSSLAGPADFEVLPELSQLRSLELSGAAFVADKQLADLTRLDLLEELCLDATSLTDAGVRELARLQRLRTLSLNQTSVSDACVDALRQLPALKEVWLFGTQVSRAGVQELAGSGVYVVGP